jgi:ABC-type transporter Mla subunit MlaD
MDPVEQLFGINLNLVDDALDAFGAGLQQVTKSLHELADSARRFSPILAATMARQEILNIQQEIRRARQLGPGLAEFVESSGDATRALNEIKAALVEQILPVVNPIMRTLAGLLEWLADNRETISNEVSNIGAALVPSSLRFIYEVLKLLGVIAENTEPERRDESTSLDAFLRFSSLDALRGAGFDYPLPGRPREE